MHIIPSRREFLTALSAAAAATAFGSRASLADEGPPETTTLRLRLDPNICAAPWYVAEDLLRAEGFTDIRYVPVKPGLAYVQTITRGDIDLGLFFRRRRCSVWIPACQSRRWRVCILDASSCSPTNPFAPSAT